MPFDEAALLISFAFLILPVVCHRSFRSRKKLVSSMALSQGLMYLPIMLVFFLGEYRGIYLILFACLYWIFGMILSPAWNSWMGDLVGEKVRGDYFGRRNMITGASSFFLYDLLMNVV